MPTRSRQQPSLPWGSTGLVVVAGGSGARFGGFKQVALVRDRPLLTHALAALAELPFAERVVVLPSQFFEDHLWEHLQQRWPEAAACRAVAGGATRAESVLAGLAALSPACEFVAVHDGARPFPPIEATARCLRHLVDHADIAGAIVCAPMTDTVKELELPAPADGRVTRTLDRDMLRRAETPQVSRRALLENALRLRSGATARDDAEALERAHHHTAALLHDGFNLKVTVPFDLVLAEAWIEHTLKRRRETHG